MVFSITRYTFTTRNHWLLNCIAKKHSLSAPEKRTPGACRTESAVLDWITKPFYVFPLRIQMYCNLNNVRIVHYQIFDVRKEAVVQTSILLHVHGSFKVFLESSKGGKCMLRSLQWHVQFIATRVCGKLSYPRFWGITTFANDSHIFHSWTQRAWMNEDVVYESTKFPNHFFWPNTHASAKNRTMSVLNHKLAKWVFDPNI